MDVCILSWNNLGLITNGKDFCNGNGIFILNFTSLLLLRFISNYIIYSYFRFFVMNFFSLNRIKILHARTVFLSIIKLINNRCYSSMINT